MQARQLWQAVLGDLQVRLSRNAYDNWVRQTTLVSFEDDIATVGAPNTFTASTLQSRYIGQIEKVITEIVGRPVTVKVSVVSSSGDTPAGSVTTANTPRERKPDPKPATQLPLSVSTGLNPRYVFDNYVVGSSNRFAQAAADAVSSHPGQKYNPLFLYGGVGLGKTHLLHAVGHKAMDLYPDLKVFYVSSEKFTNDLINAIRQQRMDDFRARYRAVDILMIDDIQFIAGKESTQEEFFHTFNTLYQSGKQVIITSDRPPKNISALEDRLRSRFEGGLICDVQLPDYEMRTAIVRTKAEEMGTLLPNEIVEYIAQKDQANIRELEGALNKILAFAQITNRPLSLQLAIEAFTDSPFGSQRHKITPEDVVESVSKQYGVTLKELRGRGRTKEIVAPRQVAMYLLREETGASLVEIGALLGDRDHTTVMHGIAKIEREIETDSSLRAHIMGIREALFTGGR